MTEYGLWGRDFAAGARYCNPMSDLSLPAGYARIRTVGSFAELVSTTFADGVNALVWPRELEGDFAEVVQRLGEGEGLRALDEERLRGLDLSPAGRVAAERLIDDLALLRAQGLAPVLDCIHGYPRDDSGSVVPTDVYSFHADRAPVQADTYLCTYTEAASEGLRQEDAVLKVDVPEIRAALLEEYGGAEDEGFREFLEENCYDLHYAARPGAVPFSFGFGHLWRIAIAYPDNPVPPCVHRAPENRPGRPPRLLLIS